MKECLARTLWFFFFAFFSCCIEFFEWFHFILHKALTLNLNMCTLHFQFCSPLFSFVIKNALQKRTFKPSVSLNSHESWCFCRRENQFEVICLKSRRLVFPCIFYLKSVKSTAEIEKHIVHICNFRLSEYWRKSVAEDLFWRILVNSRRTSKIHSQSYKARVSNVRNACVKNNISITNTPHSAPTLNHPIQNDQHIQLITDFFVV